MKCQLNALEILPKDQLKINVQPDVSETITKDFFFKEKEPLQSLVNPKETSWKAQKIHCGYGLCKKDNSVTLISTFAQRKVLASH